jgi:hypothetical protein
MTTGDVGILDADGSVQAAGAASEGARDASWLSSGLGVTELAGDAAWCGRAVQGFSPAVMVRAWGGLRSSRLAACMVCWPR